jgi:hypothetical protein
VCSPNEPPPPSTQYVFFIVRLQGQFADYFQSVEWGTTTHPTGHPTSEPAQSA